MTCFALCSIGKSQIHAGELADVLKNAAAARRTMAKVNPIARFGAIMLPGKLEDARQTPAELAPNRC